MTMFWECFACEHKCSFKSISIYIYFLLWFTFSFLCVASESFGPIGNNNGKILLNGPYANIYNDIGISFFGLIVIAAIFGTSILRDFQRDTIQILSPNPSQSLLILVVVGPAFLSSPCSLFHVCLLASFSAPSLPGPTAPVSVLTIFPGTCNRSSPSSSSRFSFWVLFSS